MEGCSTTRVYTGQSAVCNGGPGAVTTRQITIKDPEAEDPETENPEITTEVPETTIVRKPRYPQPDDTRLRFSSSIQDSTYRCSLNRARFRLCKTPKNYKNLEAGRYRFEVFAISPLGVADPTPDRVKFRVKPPENR